MEEKGRGKKSETDGRENISEEVNGSSFILRGK